MSELAKRLRSTTEAMAAHCSVGMELWDLHSNACLEAADRLTALEAEITALRTATPEMIVAAWEVARKGRPGGKVFIGPGPAFKEIYEAMSARALLAKGDGE